jgi:hypothetical protein
VAIQAEQSGLNEDHHRSEFDASVKGQNWLKPLIFQIFSRAPIGFGSGRLLWRSDRFKV